MFIPQLTFMEYLLQPRRLRVEIVLPFGEWKLITVLQDETGTWNVAKTRNRYVRLNQEVKGV